LGPERAVFVVVDLQRGAIADAELPGDGGDHGGLGPARADPQPVLRRRRPATGPGPVERVTGIEPAWPAWKGGFFEQCFPWSALNQVEAVPSDCLSAALMAEARAASRSCSACW
jgi:hypothetical protein